MVACQNYQSTLVITFSGVLVVTWQVRKMKGIPVVTKDFNLPCNVEIIILRCVDEEIFMQLLKLRQPTPTLDTVPRVVAIIMKFRNDWQKISEWAVLGNGYRFFWSEKGFYFSTSAPLFRRKCLLWWKWNYRPLESDMQCIFLLRSLVSRYMGLRMRFRSLSKTQDFLNGSEIA